MVQTRYVIRNLPTNALTKFPEGSDIREGGRSKVATFRVYLTDESDLDSVVERYRFIDQYQTKKCHPTVEKAMVQEVVSEAQPDPKKNEICETAFGKFQGLETGLSEDLKAQAVFGVPKAKLKVKAKTKKKEKKKKKKTKKEKTTGTKQNGNGKDVKAKGKEKASPKAKKAAKKTEKAETKSTKKSMKKAKKKAADQECSHTPTGPNPKQKDVGSAPKISVLRRE